MKLSRKLYMGPTSGPTIDRVKPFAPSTLLQLDNKCSAIDADYECLPAAQAMCEMARGTDDYFPCVDEHFHACRRGAGCDYRYTPTPQTCAPSSKSTDVLFAEAVHIVCDDPSKEYATEASYAACVSRMRDWADEGCANLVPGEVSGPVVGSTGWRA